MGAHTEGKDKMGERFAIVLGVAAAGVMALGAGWLAAAPQAAEAAPNKACEGNQNQLWVSGVSCHQARRVARHHDKTGDPRFNGWKCDDDKQRRTWFDTTCHRPRKGETQRIAYTKKWRDTKHAALSAQTATSSTGEPVDSVPPDLLSGKKKQSIGIDPECEIRCNKWAVEVKASCGDEACTVRANGKLTNVKGDKLIKPRHDVDLHLAPGETRNIRLVPTKSQRKPARKALAEGKNVQAKVTVKATDAAGNVATAKRTIKLVKDPGRSGKAELRESAAAAPDVKYDTELTIAKGSSGRLYHGRVISGVPVDDGVGFAPEVRKCMEGRRVVLIKQRPGADRKLGTSRSQWGDGEGHWRVVIPQTGARVYAKVRPKVSDRFVCRADRSPTYGHPRSLGAQAATSSTVEPVDSTPPDIQLSGKKKQNEAIAPGTDCGQRFPPLICGACDSGICDISVKASCGDEACTARVEAKLTNVKNEKFVPENPWVIAPGETVRMDVNPTTKTRKKAGKAIDNGKNVEAKVTVRAKDAAGNVATAKRTIRIGIRRGEAGGE